MRLAELVAVSARLQQTPGRREKTQQMAAWLRRLAPEEMEIGVHYASGRLRQGRLGIGPALLRAACAVEPAAAPTLELCEVDESLARVAAARGAGATAARRAQLAALFARATAAEQEYLARLLSGEPRQGALEGVMLEAVAAAAGVEPAQLRRAAMVEGALPAVARAVLEAGPAALARFVLRPLQPVQPMLAQTAEGVEDALARLGEAAFEFKFDGVRVQVHRAGDEVRVYTRRLQEITAAVPELIDAVRALPAESVILDGEAIALAADARPLPFQDTMRRFGRRQEVERLRDRIPLSVFFFDCLHLDGRDLVAEPARVRFEALAGVVPPAIAVPRLVTGDRAAAEEFLARALSQGHEGVLAKSLDAPYEAGRRGGAWLKIKAAQTLDLVVLAAEWGHGRRRGRLSNLHLGARDDESGRYVMLGKTFKGMTDRMLQWQTERLLQLEVSRDAYTVYVRPALVVEIAFDGLQESPQYPGGLALRFARVKRYREDKTPEQADTFAHVRALYRRQRSGGEIADERQNRG